MKTSKNDGRYKNDLAFLDMMFNMCVAFAFLFIICMMLIRPPTPVDPAIKMKAEFVLTMTWPDKALDDIDLWLMLPDGRKVMYILKDVDYVTLDRDDRGGPGDVYRGPNGEAKLNKLNKEMITIRAIVPGRYVVAAHVFGAYNKVGEFLTEQPLPYKATLEVIKLNPRVIEIAKVDVNLSQAGEDQNFIAFEVDEQGNVFNVELNPQQDQIVNYENLSGEPAR